MICCIPTKSRPETKTYQLFEESGIKVFHFIEPSEIDLYDVPNKVSIKKNNQGISYVRNFILEWSRKNNEDIVIMCDDDVTHFGKYIGKSVKLNGADIWKEIEVIARQYKFDIVGVSYRQDAWRQKKSYSVNSKMTEVCIMLNIPTIKWKYRSEFDMKEDRDFVLQSIKNGNGVLALNHYFFDCPYIGTNKGGLYDAYKENRHQKSVMKMLSEWQGFVQTKKTKSGIDLKYDMKGLAKKYKKRVF